MNVTNIELQSFLFTHENLIRADTKNMLFFVTFQLQYILLPGPISITNDIFLNGSYLTFDIFAVAELQTRNLRIP